MSKDPHAQADKIYREILELLEQLSVVYAEAANSEDEKDDEDESLDVDDVIDAMIEEAAERGLDEETADRAFKAIAALAKKTAEG